MTAVIVFNKPFYCAVNLVSDIKEAKACSFEI